MLWCHRARDSWCQQTTYQGRKNCKQVNLGVDRWQVTGARSINQGHGAQVSPSCTWPQFWKFSMSKFLSRLECVIRVLYMVSIGDLSVLLDINNCKLLRITINKTRVLLVYIERIRKYRSIFLSFFSNKQPQTLLIAL